MPDLTKAEKDKISRNEQEDIAFAEMIDRFKSGKMAVHEVLRVGTTPYCLRIAGAGAMPIKLSQSVLSNSNATSAEQISNANKKRHTSPHGISVDVLKKLPKGLRCPLIVYKGNKPNTMCSLLEIQNENKQNIFLSILFDKKKNAAMITTILGKKNADKVIETAINDKTLLAINKKVAEPKLTNHIGLADELLATICYDDSIAYTDKNVKPLSELLTEISQGKAQESKGEIPMPVQEQDTRKPQEQQSFDLDEKKPTSFEKSGKLLPILETKAEFHQSRMDTIDEKIARREDKIARNESKIGKLNAKAERLEDLNETLKEIAGSNPLAKALIERNEKKIAEIKDVLIPKREAKIDVHNDRISALQDKRRLIEHKLDRTVALSKTITSFALFGTERRQSFRSSIDELHRATARCLNDKIAALEVKMQEIGDNAPASGMDGLKARRRMNELSEKISKLKAKAVAYEELDDSRTDKLMEHTADKISESMEKQGDNISLAEVAETVSVENVNFAEQTLGVDLEREQLIAQRNDLQNDLEINQFIVNRSRDDGMISSSQAAIEKLTAQIADIDKQLAEMPEYKEPENPLKNAEMAVEGNYNMIDGIINNGADQQEIAGVYDDVERADDERERLDQAARYNDEPPLPPEPEEYTDYFFAPPEIADDYRNSISEKEVGFANSASPNANFYAANKDNADKMKAADRSFSEKRGAQIVNGGFYKSLPKTERFTTRMNEADARATADKLKSAGFIFSAVFQGERSGITIAKSDYKKAMQAGLIEKKNTGMSQMRSDFKQRQKQNEQQRNEPNKKHDKNGHNI